jgi:cyclopropane-fatty-acyl-phospholipid synthase
MTMERTDRSGSVTGRRHRVLEQLLARIAAGRLTVVTPDGARLEGSGAADGPTAEIRIHHNRLFRRLILGGDIGFAESYMDGDWSTPDLSRLLEFATINLETLGPIIERNPLVALLGRLRHLRNANTRRQSRRNIAFHYDLGNAFYRLWLDEGMTYSSALFGATEETLEAAQEAKLARIAALLDITGGESVMEIGCGWGTLACHLAAHGANVTALTISQEQAAEARARVAGSSRPGLVEVKLEDYRAIGGRFDRIVSIEMVEAVGERYWPVYFRTLRERLTPGGRAVLQAITIAEDRFEDYRRHPDFIQRYVFPGGMLPTPTVLVDQARRAGLKLVSDETFGQSYALTLAEWRRRFLAAWPKIEAQGFDGRFRRLWEYYLAYCEGGFRAGSVDVGLYVFE